MCKHVPHHGGRRSISYYVGALVIYLISLSLLLYALVTTARTSFTYSYHLYRYGPFYLIYMLLHASTVILFIIYMLLHLPLYKLTIVRYVTLFASAVLIFTNYSYLIMYSVSNNVSIAIYPLLIMLTSKFSENTVISFDWGQPAIIFLIYNVMMSYIRRRSASGSHQDSSIAVHKNILKLLIISSKGAAVV